MNILQNAIVATLKAKFPDMAKSIFPYVESLDLKTDDGVSYPAPGLSVVAIAIEEVPVDVAPFELQCEFAVVVAVKAASAATRDAQGWELTIKTAQVVYRNTWGISGMHIRPAIITSIRKNTARAADGTPTGMVYWTILFHNWIKFEGLLP